METRKFDVLLFLLVLILALAGVEAQKPSDSMSTTGGDSWEGDSSNVSPSMAVVIVVLVLGFFITGCISIYIQHCVDTSLTTTTSAAINNRNVNSMNKRGLDQSVIDTFPIFPYSAVKELKIGKGALECAVCLSEFQEDETLRFLPKCDHVFHSECIDPWLSAHATCPVCRDDLSHLPASSGDPSESSNHAVEVRIAILEAGKLPRAHSTGHSMTRDGENCERYTLRLPAEVRRELMARSKLKRAMSLVALPRQTSSRRGYRDGEGSGSSRYGRFFGRSILMRVASFRSTVKVGVDGVSSAGEKVPKSSSPTDQSVPHPLP